MVRARSPEKREALPQSAVHEMAEDEEGRVKTVEAARAEEAAKYREVTVSTVFADAVEIPGYMTR